MALLGRRSVWCVISRVRSSRRGRPGQDRWGVTGRVWCDGIRADMIAAPWTIGTSMTSICVEILCQSLPCKLVGWCRKA